MADPPANLFADIRSLTGDAIASLHETSQRIQALEQYANDLARQLDHVTKEKLKVSNAAAGLHERVAFLMNEKAALQNEITTLKNEENSLTDSLNMNEKRRQQLPTASGQLQQRVQVSEGERSALQQRVKELEDSLRETRSEGASLDRLEPEQTFTTAIQDAEMSQAEPPVRTTPPARELVPSTRQVLPHALLSPSLTILRNEIPAEDTEKQQSPAPAATTVQFPPRSAKASTSFVRKNLALDRLNAIDSIKKTYPNVQEDGTIMMWLEEEEKGQIFLEELAALLKTYSFVEARARVNAVVLKRLNSTSKKAVKTKQVLPRDLEAAGNPTKMMVWNDVAAAITLQKHGMVVNADGWLEELDKDVAGGDEAQKKQRTPKRHRATVEDAPATPGLLDNTGPTMCDTVTLAQRTVDRMNDLNKAVTQSRRNSSPSKQGMPPPPTPPKLVKKKVTAIILGSSPDVLDGTASGYSTRKISDRANKTKAGVKRALSPTEGCNILHSDMGVDAAQGHMDLDEEAAPLTPPLRKRTRFREPLISPTSILSSLSHADPDGMLEGGNKGSPNLQSSYKADSKKTTAAGTAGETHLDNAGKQRMSIDGLLNAATSPAKGHDEASPTGLEEYTDLAQRFGLGGSQHRSSASPVKNGRGILKKTRAAPAAAENLDGSEIIVTQPNKQGHKSLPDALSGSGQETGADGTVAGNGAGSAADDQATGYGRGKRGKIETAKAKEKPEWDHSKAPRSRKGMAGKGA